jgi:two-component system LytT family response regulator
MIKTLIIEDELKAADLLQLMLTDCQQDIEVIDKCPNLPAGVRSIKKHKPELIFLDIEMPGYSGLQLLEFFNEEEVDFEIIFTTAFNDYAIKAFELSAIDYLLKPIQIDKLNASIEKYLRKKKKEIASFERLSLLNQNFKGGLKRIALPASTGIEIIKVEDIMYLEADGSYTKIILSNDPPLMVSKNLKYFEEQLSDEPGFFRNHRSYIINVAFIKRVVKSSGGSIQLLNGSSLPITIERIEPLIEILSK